MFADGALPGKTKQLIAVAVAHVTQCPYCIKGHTKAALRAGASREELMEAIWVAAEMRAGGAYGDRGSCPPPTRPYARSSNGGRRPSAGDPFPAGSRTCPRGVPPLEPSPFRRPLWG